MLFGKSFGSDNHSGVHPLVMQALLDANDGHQASYGGDKYTLEVNRMFQETFGADTEVYLVFTGTAANTLAIRSCCRSFEAVISTSIAHINSDECGAPEFFSGSKILSFPAENGKLPVSVIENLRIQAGDPHRVLPKMVSITQATEVGTCYSIEEIKAITKSAHAKGLLVHMDGARIANAACFLNCDLVDLTRDAGIDILSFGGTKNGLLCAEALVFLKPGLADSFAFIRKQSMQLASKMRFLSCQFKPYLANQLWRENAKAANAMAQYLRNRLAALDSSQFPYPTEANEVFVYLPKDLTQHMQNAASAYLWNTSTGLLRFVTSFDTSEEDIDRLFVDL
ncbi:MAG: low specificity L-threonine aldolase [Proteobacteria bacterium]|nr:low specificity L-threonine aldolase [Pseudomonadota bacterium]